MQKKNMVLTYLSERSKCLEMVLKDSAEYSNSHYKFYSNGYFKYRIEDEGRVLIESLFIDQELRGTKISSKMIKSFISFLTQMNTKSFYGYVVKDSLGYTKRMLQFTEWGMEHDPSLDTQFYSVVEFYIEE